MCVERVGMQAEVVAGEVLKNGVGIDYVSFRIVFAMMEAIVGGFWSYVRLIL